MAEKGWRCEGRSIAQRSAGGYCARFMQIFESSLNGADRPCAPKECAQCGGCRTLWYNGKYPRNHGADGAKQVSVRCFRCPQCRKTWSVIPEGMLPYRNLPVARFEELMDEQLAGGGARPPPTVNEKSSVRRAYKNLSQRLSFLCGLLGQQMPLEAKTDLGCFWRALRKLGPTGDILVRLARDFKTSLLACYRSLQAHWARGEVPV